MKLSPVESQLLEKIKTLEDRISAMEKFVHYQTLTRPLDNNHCRVCGRGWGSNEWSECFNSRCPGKVSC